MDVDRWSKTVEKYFSSIKSVNWQVLVEHIMKNRDGAESSVKMLDKSIQAISTQMQTCSAYRGEMKEEENNISHRDGQQLRAANNYSAKMIVVFASTCLHFLCGRKWQVEQSVIIMQAGVNLKRGGSSERCLSAGWKYVPSSIIRWIIHIYSVWLGRWII